MPKNSTKTDTEDRGRFSARCKTDPVLRLLRGEDLNTFSRELEVVAATLSGRRDALIDGGTAAVKSRPAHDRGELVTRLRSKVGQLAMDNELLSQKCQHLGSGRPSTRRLPSQSPFTCEGYRKVCARLRHQGIRTAAERVRRLMREYLHQASRRGGHAHGPEAHDGTIATENPDEMWGTDMTTTFTTGAGTAHVFVAVD